MASSIFGLALDYKWFFLFASLALYVVGVGIYRRYFHPLSKVPGPFLPAVTQLYQTYWGPKYFEHIDTLHKQYGSIVRISPTEIHLSDPDDYDKIYFSGSKYGKGKNLYDATCVPYSTFGSTDNEVHRIRRTAMNPMFSRKMVLELEEIVQEKARKVCSRMQKAIDNGTSFDLHHAFRSVSVDVISDFAFGNCYNLLDSEDVGENFFTLTGGVGPTMYVFQQFPTLQQLALKIPPWLAPYLSKPLGKVSELQQECVRQVEDLKARLAGGKAGSERPTIFTTLLSPENKPDEYQIPSTHQLKDEAYSILMAAADTTGNAMTVAAFHVMRNPGIYRKLFEELSQKFPSSDAPLPFMDLEKLPYLTAVIKEGLRLSFGVPGRLPREVPEPGATFQGHFIPPGYVVGMSSWLMHRNEKVFPDPMKFDPERWMDPATYWQRDHHIVAFSRGTRVCVGMPLAYCELYVTLGTFFRRFPSLQVYKTTLEDMEYLDYFSSYHIRGRNWLRAVAAEAERSV